MNTKSTGKGKASRTGKPKSTAGKTTVNSKSPVKKSASGSQKLTGKALKAKSKYVDFKDKQKKGDPLPSFNENAIRLGFASPSLDELSKSVEILKGII